MISRFITNQLRLSLQSFLVRRGFPADGYVVLGRTALWLHGLCDDFHGVALLIPALDAEKEVGDFDGFMFEAVADLDYLQAGITAEVVREATVQAGIRVQSIESVRRLEALTRIGSEPL